MTQEVQPLTWSKRTNIEEHQQFFSKINEIIGNLAPTVDEAEQAIAQATAAIASANDAAATANAASAAASAAASQAQTAASTVAGYDERLTAAEGDIDALQAADQTMAGNIAALGTRMTAAESKNSQQDTAINALQAADAQDVKINAVNQYAVGLTGNQYNIAGAKIFLGECTGTSYFGLTNKRASFTINDRSVKNRSWFRLLEDINGISLIRGFYDINEDGTNQVVLSMDYDVGGTTKTVELLRVVTDVSGNVTIASIGGKVIA